MRRREFLPLPAGAAGFAKTPASVPVDPVTKSPESLLSAIHTMVDMPDWCRDLGKNWDPAKYVQLAKDAHVEIIELKTKNAMGHAMFPFRGRTCPRDWTTETRALAKQAGLRFIAYYNVGLDNWMAGQRPEWRCVDPAGKEKIAFGAYNWMCLRSPWRDLVLEELRQVTEAVRPDGVWFDLLGMPNAYGLGSFDPALACFCTHCRSAYQAAFGEEQPATSDDATVRLRVNRFGHKARVDMLRDAASVIRSVDPGIWLGSNGAGFYDRLNATPEDVQALITFNSSEAKPHKAISFRAKSMWALGKPYQVHSYGGFMRMQPGTVVGTWSAWNLIPPSYMQVSAAIVTAHAGRLSVGVNPLPDGSVRPDEFRNLAPTFAAIREREPWLAELESVPNIAVVYDPDSELALLPLAGQRGAMPVQQETTGLHDALLESGMHFDIINSGTLAPERYRAVLVGNAVCPLPGLLDKLRNYVSSGGLLVVTNETSLRDRTGQKLPDFGWADLLGVRYRGVSPFQEANYGWLRDELRGEAPAYPFLFLSEVLEVQSTTARPLAELIYPEGHRSPTVFTDGETAYTHFQSLSGKPLITANRVGKGTVVYIAGPIGQQIATRDDPWLKRIVATAVRKYAGGPTVEVIAPPGVLAVFGRQKPKAGREAVHVLSLVNLYAGMVTSADRTLAPRVGPLHVRVPLSFFTKAPTSVHPIDAKITRWRVTTESLEADIDSIGHHALLIVT